jgi:DNA-binding response OmpR family regulator
MAKILIVDDDVVNSQVYVNKLQSEGHAVELITDGSIAQGRIGEKFDLILLDVMMPGMDGFSLLQEFRKGTNKQTPIFIFTNLVSEDTKKQAQEFHSTEVLYKVDTTPQDLLTRIHALIGKAPQMQEKQEQNTETDILKEAVK